MISVRQGQVVVFSTPDPDLVSGDRGATARDAARALNYFNEYSRVERRCRWCWPIMRGGRHLSWAPNTVAGPCVSIAHGPPRGMSSYEACRRIQIRNSSGDHARRSMNWV